MLHFSIRLYSQHSWDIHGKLNLSFDYIDTSMNKNGLEIVTVNIHIKNKSKANCYITDIRHMNNDFFNPWLKNDTLFFRIGKENYLELSDYKYNHLIKIGPSKNFQLKCYISLFNLEKNKVHEVSFNYLDSDTAVTKTKPRFLILENNKRKKVPAEYLIFKSEYPAHCKTALLYFW